MARNEFVKARVSPEEKEIYQQLCEQAGCTEVMVNIAIWIAVAVASAIILSFCYEFFTK